MQYEPRFWVSPMNGEHYDFIEYCEECEIYDKHTGRVLVIAEDLVCDYLDGQEAVDLVRSLNSMWQNYCQDRKP